MGGARGTLAAGGLVETGLARAGRAASERGVAVPPLRGKLLRPRTALAFVPPERRDRLSDRFWLGCLAVQMAHEASLHHDDVLDGGAKRRNSSSLLGAKGAGAALLAGDLCLTGSYRVALMTRSEGFLTAFTEAVETTVRGEKMQGEVSARGCHADGYLEVVRAKSGALFGAAAGLAGWAGDGAAIRSARELRELGIEFGAFYQLVDDFLDYCPGDDTGKPKLQDFRNRVWTSVLGDRGPRWFDLTPEEALREFFRKGTERYRTCPRRSVHGTRGAGGSARARLGTGGQAPRGRGRPGPRRPHARMDPALRAGGGGRPCEPSRVTDPRKRIHTALPHRRPAAGGRAGRVPPPSRRSPPSRPAPRRSGPGREWGRYFARHSRSFSFAARLFAPEERRRVREIYAWCRFTDDLVDETSAPGRRPASNAGRLGRDLPGGLRGGGDGDPSRRRGHGRYGKPAHPLRPRVRTHRRRAHGRRTAHLPDHGRTAPLYPSGRVGGGRLADVFVRRARRLGDRARTRAGARDAAHQHHPRCRRGPRARAALPPRRPHGRPWREPGGAPRGAGARATWRRSGSGVLRAA